MRNLLIFSIFAVFSLNAFSADSMFIPHKEFVNLEQKQKEFYVKAIRESVVAVMSTDSTRSNQASFLKETWLIEVLFPNAIANDSLEGDKATKTDPKVHCVSSGYIDKIHRTGKVTSLSDGKVVSLNDGKVVSLSDGKVVSLNDGKVVSLSGMPQELCGGKPGFATDEKVNISCDPDKVGAENKYPCLPVMIYGFTSNGNVFCVSANPLRNAESRSKYLDQCRTGSDQIKTSASKAAATIELNPENYENLGQHLSYACKRKKPLHENMDCGRAIAKMEEANTYVGSKKSNNTAPARSNQNSVQ